MKIKLRKLIRAGNVERMGETICLCRNMVGEMTFCKTKAIDGRIVQICVTEMGCGRASYGSD